MKLRDKVGEIVKKVGYSFCDPSTESTPEQLIELYAEDILQAVRDMVPEKMKECPLKDYHTDDLAIAWNDCIDEINKELE